MPRQTTIPSKTITEEIRAIEDYTNEKVRVTVGSVDENGVFIHPQNFEVYDIVGDDYAELVSDGPEWAPGKPAGTYRRDDLWRFIDKLRWHNV